MTGGGGGGGEASKLFYPMISISQGIVIHV